MRVLYCQSSLGVWDRLRGENQGASMFDKRNTSSVPAAIYSCYLEQDPTKLEVLRGLLTGLCGADIEDRGPRSTEYMFHEYAIDQKAYLLDRGVVQDMQPEIGKSIMILDALWRHASPYNEFCCGDNQDASLPMATLQTLLASNLMLMSFLFSITNYLRNNLPKSHLTYIRVRDSYRRFRK
jgi:hypothetical protein